MSTQGRGKMKEHNTLGHQPPTATNHQLQPSKHILANADVKFKHLRLAPVRAKEVLPRHLPDNNSPSQFFHAHFFVSYDATNAPPSTPAQFWSFARSLPPSKHDASRLGMGKSWHMLSFLTLNHIIVPLGDFRPNSDCYTDAGGLA